MYCKNCGNEINPNNISCDKCGEKQDSQTINITTKSNKLTKIWIGCTIGLVILSFVVLLSGVVIGVGSGYENHNSKFDFTPFCISFLIIHGFNIVFNIIMIIAKKTKKL